MPSVTDVPNSTTTTEIEPQILEEAKTDNDTSKGPDFPEGGLTAWLVVGGCFCVMFLTFGYLNAFGYVSL